MWKCPSCAEQNPDGMSACAVCATRGSAAGVPLPGPSLKPAPMAFTGPRRFYLLGLLSLVSVGVTLAIAVPRVLGSDEPEQPPEAGATAAAEPPTAEPPTAEPPTAEPPTAEPPTAEPPTVEDDGVPEGETAEFPTPARIVAVDPAVADYRTAEVAAMFETYFGGINSKDFDAVGSVLEPPRTVDAKLRKGYRSTHDSSITLLTIGTDDDGLLTAEVSFRSSQDPGDGPPKRTQETCTQWDVDYTISESYRILHGHGTSAPC